jgi:hypothetical protein
MNRLLMFMGMTVGGYLGWYIGESIGFGLMGTFLVGSLGSIAGVYGAWRLGRDFFGR